MLFGPSRPAFEPDALDAAARGLDDDGAGGVDPDTHDLAPDSPDADAPHLAGAEAAGAEADRVEAPGVEAPALPTSSHAEDEALLAALAGELDAVDAALVRLDNGSFDRCEVCGGEIGHNRLVTDPLLTRCPAHT